ncbi:TIM barrel protein [Curvibacter sp. CHRR-16]|uniref:hydroxypyruvate isomerase family protein n=1 Tax=Curvibacter sp. CHRR-16 TaxID=2835872 RepID=UPI001BD9CB07|nr:TIM barrel protein [Curvibacter sp. CHRR-16]MBT0570337.1 TIM barrel protein [Curvibacter sp. CHRR-16]
MPTPGLRFAANLSFLYPELPFPQRFAAAAADGFVGVEYLFPYAHPARDMARWLADAGLEQVLFNAPPAGHTHDAMVAAWDLGERGTACLPGREAEFRTGFALALDYAHTLGCPRVHVMSGCVPSSVSRNGGAAVSSLALRDTLLENLAWALPQAQAAGVTLLLEPLNGRDVPGYYLRSQAQAHAIVELLGSPALQVQMDLYHCQISEGDVTAKLRQYLPTGRVGHIQIASVPERQEPDGGELHYPYVLGVLQELGYRDWIGCEYRPRGGTHSGATSAGLQWLRTPS